MARPYNKTVEYRGRMPVYEGEYDHLYGPIYGRAFFEYEQYSRYENTRCRKWEPYNKHQLKIYLDTGRTVLYNILDKSTRTLFETDYSDESFKRDFVYNVRDRLRAKGMTAGQLAEKLGVSANAVSAWMTRQALPSAPMLMRIARELGCTADELMMNC